jgi:hypothetical protein
MRAMRRTLFFLLLVLGVGAGLGFYVEARHAADLSRQLAEAQQKLKLSDGQLVSKAQAIRELEHKTEILAAESKGLRGKLKVAEVATPAVTASSGTDAQADKKGDFGGQLSKMMKDPAFKNMMKPQMQAQMKKMYGALFKKLNLDPETERKLTDLIVDQSLSAMDMGGNLYSGDKEKLKQSTDEFKTKQEEFDKKIADLLGADGATQYKDYQKTLADRMVLDGFSSQLSGVNSLQPQQADALLKIMTEERASAPQMKINDQSDPAGAMKELGTPGALDKFVDYQNELNKRVTNRAISVLTPEQYKQLQEFQKQQIEMQKFGLKMAGQLMSPKQSGTGGE